MSKKIDLFEIIKWLDKHEKWVNSSEQVNSDAIRAINILNGYEDNGENLIIEGFEELSFIVETAAYLRFDIFMLMFTKLGVKQKGFGGDALMFCYDNIEGDNNQTIKGELSVIMQRIGILVKAELAYKIFGEENRNRVIQAIDELEKEMENEDK